MRAERLQEANKIALSRWRRWQKRWGIYSWDGPVGRFRKWNQTCACHLCGGRKLWEKKSPHWVRDYRRNGDGGYGET